MGGPCSEVSAKKFTAARIYRFLSTKRRAVKSGEQKFTAKGTLRGGLRVQTSLQLLCLIALGATCLLAEGTFAAAVNNEVWGVGFGGPLQ